MEAGAAIVRDPDVRRLRALEMIQMRMVGTTIEAIAAHFNCDHNTVSRTIQWAGKTGIIDTAENQILQSLVPKALKVYSDALDNGDTFAAKHVIDKLSEMAERADRRRDKGEDRMLEVWMKEREARKRADKGGTETSVADAGHPRQGDEGVIDAQVISEEAGQPVGEDGPERPAGGTPAFLQASRFVSEVEP